MRQKKSNFMYYLIVVILLTAVGFVVSHEFPLHQEHIEESVK